MYLKIIIVCRYGKRGANTSYISGWTRVELATAELNSTPNETDTNVVNVHHL